MAVKKKKKAARVKRTLEQRQALRIEELEERLETYKEHAIKDAVSTDKVLKAKTKRIKELEKKLVNTERGADADRVLMEELEENMKKLKERFKKLGQDHRLIIRNTAEREAELTGRIADLDIALKEEKRDHALTHQTKVTETAQHEELLEATRADCKKHLKAYELEREKTAHLDSLCSKMQKQIRDIVTRLAGGGECVMTFHRDQRAPELLLRDLHAMVKLAYASHQTVVLDVTKGSPDEHLTVKVCPVAFEGGEITKPGVQQ